MYICTMSQEEEVKQKLLIKAMDEFLSKGFKSVTMDDLAAVMGMSKKTIYTYYKKKTDLVEAATDYFLELISHEIEKVKTKGFNPIEEMFAMNDLVNEKLKDENSSPLYQLEKYYGAIHQKQNAKKLAITKSCLTHNIEKGISQGLYRADTNVELVIKIHYVVALALKNIEVFPVSDFPVQKTRMEHIIMHIRSIATEKGLQILEQIIKTRKL